MFDTIRDLFSEKVAVRAVLRGFVSNEAALTLQVMVRSNGLKGSMRVAPYSYVMMELEGTRARIDQLIEQMKHTTFSTQPTVLELTWKPYRAQYINFHVAFA
jgi:hypothetical protein